MLIVTGSVTARPDTFEVLRQAALDHVTRSRTEPGCLMHAVYTDCEEPMRLVFYEEWADRASLDVHFAQSGSAEFMRAVRDLSAASSRVRILPVSERD